MGLGSFLFGERFTPDAQAAQLEGRDRLDSQLHRTAGLGQDVFGRRLGLADQLGEIAAGQRAGAGELAARRMGQQGLAQQQAMAAGARGYGGLAAARGAARNMAQMQTNTSGMAQQAALADAAQARGLQANVLGGLGAQQMGALGQMAQMRQAEMGARMQHQGMLAQQAMQDQGFVPGLLQAGAGLGAAYLMGPRG